MVWGGRAIRLLEYIYFGAVVLAVVPLGAVYPLMTTLVCLAFGALTIVAICLPSQPRNLERLKYRLAVLVMVLFVWCLLQAWQLPYNPLANTIWHTVHARFGGSLASISVNPAATREGLLSLAAPCLAAFSGLSIFRNDDAAQRLWRFLSRFSALLILITLIQYVALPRTLLIYKKWAYEFDYTATFVNRNTAATFIGVALLLNISVLLHLRASISYQGLYIRIKSFDLFSSNRYRRFILQAGVCFFMFIALFLTSSRAGVGVTLFAIILLGAVIFAQDPPDFLKSRLLSLSVGGAGLVIFAILVVWTFGGITIERIAERGLEDDERLCTYVASIKAIGDNFWLGTGFGTFVDVFPSYRDPDCAGILGTWDRAHNSYLEFILGVGAIGYLIIAAAFVIILTPLIKSLSRQYPMRFAPLSAIAIFVLIALHAIVDFSIQIPGFAVFAAAALVAGLALSSGGTSMTSAIEIQEQIES